MGAELSGFLASDGNHRWIGVGTGPVSGPRHRQRRVKARGIYKDKDRGVWIFRSLSFPHTGTLPRPPPAGPRARFPFPGLSESRSLSESESPTPSRKSECHGPRTRAKHGPLKSDNITESPRTPCTSLGRVEYGRAVGTGVHHITPRR